MKKSAIIGKKQIVLSVLAVGLAAAVFLNWKLTSTRDLTAGQNEDGNYLGAAQYVDAKTGSIPSSGEETGQDDYFATAKKDREQARKTQKDTLTEIVENLKTDAKAKEEAEASLLALAKAGEVEANIETLLKAKSFKECLAIVNGDQVSVIVRSTGLVGSQTMQIQDIVRSQMTISLENIKILEIN